MAQAKKTTDKKDELDEALEAEKSSDVKVTSFKITEPGVWAPDEDGNDVRVAVGTVMQFAGTEVPAMLEGKGQVVSEEEMKADTEAESEE